MEGWTHSVCVCVCVCVCMYTLACTFCLSDPEPNAMSKDYKVKFHTTTNWTSSTLYSKLFTLGLIDGLLYKYITERMRWLHIEDFHMKFMLLLSIVLLCYISEIKTTLLPLLILQLKVKTITINNNNNNNNVYIKQKMVQYSVEIHVNQMFFF